MRHDDRLRDLLHRDVADVEPDPGGWERIEWKLARAQRVHRLQRGGLAAFSMAAVLLAVVIATGMLGDDDTEVKTLNPTTTAAPTTEPPPVAAVSQGIWPFTDDQEADAYTGSEYRDPVATAEAFLREYAGFTRLQMGAYQGGDSRSGEVTATTRTGGPVTTVLVRRVGTTDRWTVIGAVTDNIRLDEPGALDTVTSPVHIAGESTAFEGTVNIEVRQDGQLAGDTPLAETFLTGGSMGEMGPLVGDVEFTSPTQPGGAVLALTSSAEDGHVEELAAQRVLFGEQAGTPVTTRPELTPADPTIVAVTGEADIVVLGLDGEIRRTLVPHGTGADGLALSPDGRTVFFSRFATECASEIAQVSVEGGPVVPIGPGRAPAVSFDGTRLAYAADADCDGQDELVVRELDTGEEQRWPDLDPGAGDEGLPVALTRLSWSPDGRTVAYAVQLEDGVGMQLHDVTKATTVTGNARRLQPPGAAGTVYRDPVYIATGEKPVISAIELQGYGVEACQGDVVSVDPATRTVTGRNHVGLLESHDWSTDEQLLWISVAECGGAPSLYRLIEGEPQLVADGIVAAVW